jgi:hypothetical protein
VLGEKVPEAKVQLDDEGLRHGPQAQDLCAYAATVEIT